MGSRRLPAPGSTRITRSTRPAETWLAGNIHHGWASCPLTQNGCVRILSQAAYPNALNVTDAVMRLRAAVSGPPHRRFVPDSVSLLG